VLPEAHDFHRKLAEVFYDQLELLDRALDTTPGGIAMADPSFRQTAAGKYSNRGRPL